MYKKKAFFITFEGIEGSGKSYLSKRFYKKIKRMGFKTIYTREPGGTLRAERIRNIILKDYFNNKSKEKFDKYTDTLLYLAARNEHIKNKIGPAMSEKKIVICDRFTDSTTAYQVYGKKVNYKFIENIHKQILGNLKPNLTFVLRVKISKALKRMNKRKSKNRYDKLSKSFYTRAQNAFIKIAKKNTKRYFMIDNSKDSNNVENIILNKFIMSYQNANRSS